MVFERLTTQKLSALTSLICFLCLVFAAYVQYSGYRPCPLCILQRYVFLILGTLFFFGGLFVPSRMVRRIFYGFCLFWVLVGLALALWQLKLQSAASSLPNHQDCSVGVEYMLQHFPLAQAFRLMFSGLGSCSDQGWALLKLSMAAWTALVLLLIGIISVFQMWRKDFS